MRLVYSTIKVVQEHFLGKRHPLAHRKKLQHRVLLAGKMHTRAVDFAGLGIEVDYEVVVWMTECAWPLERRTMAWMRATNSSRWNGLVM
jgi:hypothetical protein